jgi:drug/metabolite transporter (DMT)-like permease
LVAAGAFSYGITIVINRDLATAGFRVNTVLGIRFGVAAAALLVILAASRRSLLPLEGERVRVFLLGFFGYAIESTFFYSALQRGSAAAVSLLFYAYPAVVAIIGAATGREPLRRRTAIALALSAGGTVLVVTGGGTVSVTTMGVVFALGSAVSFAIYLTVSHALVHRTHSLTISAWVALGASLSFVLRGVLLSDLQSPSGHLPAMIGNGLATSAAFTFMFAGLKRLGPGQTSVVMTLEALFAIILAGLFLDETLRLIQIVGGIGLLVATVIVGLSRGARADEAVESVP